MKTLQEIKSAPRYKCERFYLRKDDPVILPDALKADPDKHGGLGLHMLNAIRNGVITIPLTDNPQGGCGSCVSIQTTNIEDALRIVQDGGVDVHANGYWCSILAAVPTFAGTDEPVPMWGVTPGDSVIQAFIS